MVWEGLFSFATVVFKFMPFAWAFRGLFWFFLLTRIIFWLLLVFCVFFIVFRFRFGFEGRNKSFAVVFFCFLTKFRCFLRGWMSRVGWMRGANFWGEVLNSSIKFLLSTNFCRRFPALVGRFRHDRKTWLNFVKRRIELGTVVFGCILLFFGCFIILSFINSLSHVIVIFSLFLSFYDLERWWNEK